MVGVDNLSDVYDLRVKEYRLGRLHGRSGFRFERLDIADRSALETAAFRDEKFDGVLNLAARAGASSVTCSRTIRWSR